MSPWQSASSSSTQEAGNAPGRHHLWPEFLVRWLFGRGDEERATQGGVGLVSPAFRISASVARPAPEEEPSRRLVGKRLGWKVYDEELIEAIAHRMEVPLDEVRTLDELAPSVVQDWLLPLREEYYAPQEAYLDHLAKLIEAIGRAGESILVGRGANFMLPREATLVVRINAPLKVRAIRLAERMGVSVRTARRAARDLDRRRLQFDRTMHRANSNDPHNYDMVLESHSLGLELAAEVIVRAVELGRPQGAAPNPLIRSTVPDLVTARPERSVATSERMGPPLTNPVGLPASNPESHQTRDPADRLSGG